VNARALNALAGVICRAQENGKQTPMGLAIAVESAGLLLSPESAAELERLRERVAELEAAPSVQRRAGYEAAIEVMRSEKLPMSVGLLEAQLELDKLDGLMPTEVTVYRASHESIVFGLYTTAEAAREHCETLMRREEPNATFDWIEDEEEGVAELAATIDADELVTGYVVTALTVASAYDPEVDE
jgi:hypothetical protein